MSRNITKKEYLKRAEQLVKRVQKDVKPFKDDSKAAKDARKARAKEDLLYLCKTYLPHYFEDPMESGHQRIAGALKNWYKVIQVWGFRGLGKTTVVGTGYALQCILYKKTHYLPIISDTTDLAELIMLPAKVELEENPRIQQDFGDQKGIEWSEDAFVTTGNVKVEAHSWRSFKRGRKHMQYRAKVAILDDVETKESVKNKEQVDKRYDTVMSDVLNGLNLKKEWQMVWVTNKLARYDCSKLLEDNGEVLTIRVPAEMPNGRATHPDTFPKKVLNAIKKVIGVVRYNLEYLGKVISSEDDDFQEKWLVYLDEPAEYKYIVMALDPSVGSTTGHDTKAWIVLGLTSDEKHMDLIWSWIRNTTIHSMCRQGFSLNSRFNPHKAVVESNGFQVLLKDKMREMAQTEDGGFSLMSKIKQLPNNTNKNSRILRLQAPVENGTFRIVRGAGDNDRFVNQLLEFDSSSTNNEDDGPDAAEMAKREIDVLLGKTGTVEVEVIG